ncbi:endonuclease/exonuclease/phosphatase family protein [Microbispora sp. RL4-1S]|uniref:Endonuclease/exonuclease/phosphatase family protein n=1 Tax=Microbispora oryzae TaxID=2806554 RepID=A0A941ANJ5_9ACTN|nr:endonuclease/exonuclease/phosphatase family protein [Microbispora oryzae]MBP2708418.1 endonuclease/exonuclease/phosphatase family protein [Microbispora oryzae]
MTGVAARAATWTGRAVAGGVAAWLLVGLVTWSSGRFWWGGAAPMLLAFAAPVAVLGAAATPLLARLPLSRGERALAGLCLAALLLAVLRPLLSGRTWVWVVPDLMVPPLLFALLPAALLAMSLAASATAAATAVTPLLTRLSPTARRWSVLPAAAALVLGLGQSGLEWRAPLGGGGAGPAPPGALRVVSWDTLCWNEGDDPARFLRYLKRWRADVYLLQEHAGCAPGALVPLHDEDLLRREFPGSWFATADGLLTISRYPVVGRTPVGWAVNPAAGNWNRAALRTDVRVGDRVVSLYNVHLYDMLYLDSSPLSGRFYRSIRTLDAARRTQIDQLTADLSANRNPLLASGDFNMLPGTGFAGRMDRWRDASRAGTSISPATLTFAGLRLWRMDWTFTSPDLRVHRYDLRSPEGLSSHHLQDMVVSLPPRP